MEFKGKNIFGSSRYEKNVDDETTIYCEMMKNEQEAIANFVVGRPGGTATMSREESKDYRLGVEGDVFAWTGKHADRVLVNFYEKDACFADFYAEDGQVIKKMISHDDKYYMLDGDSYYEVVSDAERVGLESHETFISKDEEHKYVHADLISEKEKFAKMFLEMFETLR